MNYSKKNIRKCLITGQDAQFYCQKDDGKYFINHNNDVIFLSPMPNVGNMKEYANEHYQTGVYKDYVEAKELKILTANVRLEQIKKYHPGKKMLDVGCAAGFFLETAQAKGYQVQGIEFASAAISQANPAVRDKIIQGDVHQELDRWKEGIDWVSAFDIIEHMHEPVKFVADIKKILNPGGLLVMSTPDTSHFLRRLMGNHWPMLQPLQHTVLFSRNAMNDMLTAVGFVNITIEPTYKYLTFEYLTKQLLETNQLISAIMKVVLAIVPKKLARLVFRVNISEFIVFAQKPEC